MHTHKNTQTHTKIYTNRHTGLEKQQCRHIHKTCRHVYMHKCTQMCTDCHRHTEKTHRRKDADTHCTSHFFSDFFFVSVCFIFLQLESGAAAPCTLLDTSNFLKQSTSFATQHASLNSYYTEDPFNFALRTYGV